MRSWDVGGGYSWCTKNRVFCVILTTKPMCVETNNAYRWSANDRVHVGWSNLLVHSKGQTINHHNHAWAVHNVRGCEQGL